MANRHCTHQCVMCKFEKRYSLPSPADRRRNLWRKDLLIESQQEELMEYLGALAQTSEECDEMNMAFGHDLHRSMLMTQYEVRILKGSALEGNGLRQCAER